MTKLASDAIGAAAIFPIAVAFPVFEGASVVGLDEFVFAVCESAFILVGAVS